MYGNHFFALLYSFTVYYLLFASQTVVNLALPVFEVLCLELYSICYSVPGFLFFQYHAFNIHLFLWYIAVIHTYIPQFIINYTVDGYLSHFWFWDTLNSAVMNTLVYASIQYTGMF